MKGFLLGALGLIALEVLVTGNNSGNAVGGFFDVMAKGVRMFVDPTVPAFKWKAAAPASSSGGAPRPVSNPTTNPFGLPATPLGVPSVYA